MVSSYMSWSDGVDVVGLSSPDLTMPDVIIHFARLVHTPIGSAPAGMVLIPDAANPGHPRVMGFVSPNPTIAAFFGPQIFAGTPFEKAPVLIGTIDVGLSLPEKQVMVRILAAGLKIEATLTDLGVLQLINRPAGNLPFSEYALEARAGGALVKVNGELLTVTLPAKGMNGGPAAVYSATGFYAR